MHTTVVRTCGKSAEWQNDEINIQCERMYLLIEIGHILFREGVKNFRNARIKKVIKVEAAEYGRILMFGARSSELIPTRTWLEYTYSQVNSNCISFSFNLTNFNKESTDGNKVLGGFCISVFRLIFYGLSMNGKTFK